MTAAQKPNAAPTILVVDDEAVVRDSLRAWFRDDGYEVDVAEGAHRALELLGERAYDIALLDIKMPEVDGLALQARMRELCPETTVVMMTAYASVETAVQALKAGAYDYIVKPFDPDELSHLIERAHEHRSLQSENLRLKRSLEAVATPLPIVGVSPAMRHVVELIRKVAPTDATVLVQGPSGTGKELVARAVHAQSPRRYDPLVTVHCGALAEGVLESELFGHEKGAFTGASHLHQGKFEQADGGTIFLDEIGDIRPQVQVDLLRVLEEKRVTRVGGRRSVPVDFRVVAATNRDLRALTRTGEFREDLFWRLNVVPIDIPPLRERPEDVLPLAEHFLGELRRSMNRRDLRLSDEARERLQAYPWPGNARELQNAIERAVVLGSSPCVEVRDLPRYVREDPPQPPSTSLADVERAHVRAVLEDHDWNVTHAARALGIDRGTLYHKMHRFELARP